MRFICSEFNENTNELYYKSPIDQAVISEGGYFYTKSNKIDTKDGGVSYSYLTDVTRKTLLSSWYYDGTARTIATFITNSGLTGTDNTSYSNTFDWNVKSAMQIRSGYFYTIISEGGLVFAKPERISTSVQIASYDILSEYLNSETEYAFEGETATKYKVSDEKETVTPISLDSPMKTARMNKYKSLQNVITFQSGYDANPLDYIFRNGKIYVIMSRALIKTDLYMYTAVLEVTTTYTFSGSTLTPFKAVKVNSDSFSSTETATNQTWTDGKTIYRKAVNCGAAPNATTKTTAHGLTGIGEFVRIYGILNNGGGSYYATPFFDYVGATAGITLFVDGTNISQRSHVNMSGWTPHYVILEYTKA